MEQLTHEQQEAANQVYNYAANLLIHSKKSEKEVIESLTKEGISKEGAIVVVENLREQINSAKRDRAKKDILYGGLWCAGGTIATLADIGFIFWGAILFGGIQLIKGLINYN